MSRMSDDIDFGSTFVFNVRTNAVLRFNTDISGCDGRQKTTKRGLTVESKGSQNTVINFVFFYLVITHK